MNIHEYQAKALLAARGLAAPSGRLAATPEQAARAFDELHLQRAVVKAQIHAGGRGKAGGVLFVSSRAEAEAAAKKLLGCTLVTAQTGPRGRPVNQVLVQERLDLARELYLGVSLDRSSGRPQVIAAARGGMEIEELARTDPTAILCEYGDPDHGLAPFQARNLFTGLRLPHEQMKPAMELILSLARTFIECDCSLIEVNPLALCADGRLLIADLKMAFDDTRSAGIPTSPRCAIRRRKTRARSRPNSTISVTSASKGTSAVWSTARGWRWRRWTSSGCRAASRRISSTWAAMRPWKR